MSHPDRRDPSIPGTEPWCRYAVDTLADFVQAVNAGRRNEDGVLEIYDQNVGPITFQNNEFTDVTEFIASTIMAFCKTHYLVKDKNGTTLVIPIKPSFFRKLLNRE